MRAHLARRDDPIAPNEAPASPRAPSKPLPAQGPTRNELDLIGAELEERSARLTRRPEDLQAREQRLAEELAALNAAGRLKAPEPAPGLDAARMLLGAAYPTDAASDSTPAADDERLEDELARLRDRRLEWGQNS